MDLQSANLTYKREVLELSLLFEISQKLTNSMDLKEAVEPILQLIARHMGMLRGTLTLVSRQSGEIYIESAYGLSFTQRQRGRYKLGEGITGKVIQTGEPAVVPRISEEPLFLNRTGARRNLDKKDISFICVPIKIGSETIGALSVDRLFEEKISLDEDLRLLTIISYMISQAVHLRQDMQDEKRQLLEENLTLKQELKDQFKLANIIGNSSEMLQVYNLISQVAKNDTTVLLRGESGTGKELLAHAIHYSSYRADKSFIKVNCAALPETVLESELFGHEKGAFTGAIATRKGRFELANGGTIFLDEIGDLTITAQIRLLRILQEKEFERVGGSVTFKTDVRIITATNQSLEDLINEKRFREDLYYRLNVFPIYIPPLRDRKTDILLLADHFIEKYNRLCNKKVRCLSSQATGLLFNYNWPGNVRELENCMERAVLLSSDGVIHAYLLPPSLQTKRSLKISLSENLKESIASFEKNMILEALKNTAGNMRKASKILDLTEREMGIRLQKYGIGLKEFKKTLKEAQ